MIDLRTLWPWDRETVFASIEKIGRVIVAHESTKVGGFGGEVLAEIGENFWGKLKAAPMRLGRRGCRCRCLIRNRWRMFVVWEWTELPMPRGKSY